MSSEEVSARIHAFLKENGFAEGVTSTCQHACGMVGARVACVLPEWSPVDGSHTLVVTPTEVVSMTCLIPYNYNDWRVRARWNYSSPEQLKEILGRETKKPMGCWA